MQYKRKALMVEAVQWFKDGDHPEVKYSGMDDDGNSYYTIKTLQGRVAVNYGDWIITNHTGESYPCNPATFEMNYEEVKE